MTDRNTAVGIVGLGSMGHAFASHLSEKGWEVHPWDLNPTRTKTTAEELGIDPPRSLGHMIDDLPKPRRVLMMLPAGEPVDDAIDILLPHLEEGDIVIDGGNSLYEDSMRRAKKLARQRIEFVGMGVSGGVEGARTGASLMPACSEKAWSEIQPMLESIAAEGEEGPCVARTGTDGAGHFVKTVHNGIEYATVQALGEAYALYRDLLGLSPDEIADKFEEANEGPFESWMLEMAARVLRTRDGNGDGETSLVDMIVDQAEPRTTALWALESALELGVAVPSISAAVNARRISYMRDHRELLSEVISPAPVPMGDGPDREDLERLVIDALHASVACVYIQGFDLLRTASTRYQWNLDLSEIARIWMGGCIIRTKLLRIFCDTCRDKPQATSLLLCRCVSELISSRRVNWARCLGLAQQYELAMPLTAASLAWYDGMRTQRLPQNLTQALRDACGAHGYERVDDPGVVHHGGWTV